jgi:flagellin
VQSSNDSNSSSDRQSLNQEYQALASEVKRVSIVTDFNSVFLLNGNQTLSFQVGWENGVNNIVTISTHSILSMSGVSAIGVGAAAGISTQLSANHLISVMDVAINKISTVRADFGSIQNRMEAAIRNMQNVSENQSAARSRVQDADFAAETAALTRAQILQQAGTAMLAQANQLPQNVLRLLQ